MGVQFRQVGVSQSMGSCLFGSLMCDAEGLGVGV